MSSEINRQPNQTPWDYNVWKEWQDYQKLSESRKYGVVIGSGIGVGLSVGAAFFLRQPEVTLAVPIIMTTGNIIIRGIEKGADKVGKGLGMIPMTKN